MLITDEMELKIYSEDMRIWQGMPSIEVTKEHRTFVTFCTNGTAEQLDNFVLLTCSQDGEHFKTIAAAKAALTPVSLPCFQEGNRYYHLRVPQFTAADVCQKASGHHRYEDH